jgi:cyanate lyase
LADRPVKVPALRIRGSLHGFQGIADLENSPPGSGHDARSASHWASTQARTEDVPMTRDDVTELVRDAKRTSGKSWKELAAAINPQVSPIVITAALLGQMTLTKPEAESACKVLGLPTTAAALLAEIPYRGSLPAMPPTDPLIYRFYELVMVYGTSWKELIQEEFGDGIMSAIDFDMKIERVADPKGDRVKIGMTGKFLPYKRY